MKRLRFITVLFVFVATPLLSAGAIGCAEGELEEESQAQNDDENDRSEEPEEHTEVHQLCAAAGDTSDGHAEALHCFAPHDVSGFEASDGEHTWKPGAFQVVAE